VSKGEFWDQLKHLETEWSLEINETEVDRLFHTSVAKKTTTNGSKKSKKPQGSDSVLEYRRVLVIQGNWKSFADRRSCKDTESLIEDIRELRLSAEDTHKLLRVVGTQRSFESDVNEIEKLSANSRSQNEQLLLQLNSIRNVVRHLKLFRETLEIPDKLKEEGSRLRELNEVMEKISSSRSWKAMASILLAFSNYLNTDGYRRPRGGYNGFLLDSIGSFYSTALSTDNKLHLIDYIADVVLKLPEAHPVHQFVDDFDSVSKANRKLGRANCYLCCFSNETCRYRLRH
jgi:hypothetical protein